MEASSSKSAKKSLRKRLAAMLAVSTGVVLVAAACYGCSPQAPSESESSSDAQSQEVDLGGYPNFLDNDSGMFADTYYNTELLNTGNRGCNACHTNLFDVMDLNEDGFEHIMVSTGFDKNGTYKDCEPCHRTHQMLTGPYMGDIVHASHYSNETFVAANGNCWSCHAVNSEGAEGEYQFVLWDDFMESSAVGGYPTAATDLGTRDWALSRGFSGGYLTSMSVESDPQIEVSFKQEATPTEDVFIVNNWGPEVTGKGVGENTFKIEGEDETFDWDAVNSEENAVTITGVNNPQSFTKADLEAMPQTEFTMNLACGTNGNGGCLTANVPMTGVSMEYIIELCGGLVEGNNAVMPEAWDGWVAMNMPLDASIYTHDAYLVTKQYGQDLTPDQGAPIMIASKGGAGVTQVKHVKSINFMQAENPFSQPGQLTINGMWYQNNGATYKLGDPIELSAAVYSFNRQVGDIQTVSFSFDKGQTWIDFDMADEIEGYDPYQWTQATISWTPSGAGSYQIMAQASTADGTQMKDPISLFVVVEE